jgi:thioesterase domain-containing protein/acyl carrier protein
VPSLMRQIVDAIAGNGIDASRFDKLRMIFIGGDAVPPELLKAMHRTFRRAEIRILYGPTETAVICAQYPVPRDKSTERYMIGSPMNHAKIRLCDVHGNLVPIGVPGELCIGGPGVTRGYFGRDDLTAAQFVVIDGERWYKSGDLARCLPDGTLEFLGRIDSQVKIRGFRIELGEIEAALGKHPAVAEAVVLAREIKQGDKQLVAYVSPKGKAALSASDLRSHLQANLPEHMVPSFFVLLDEMPMTPTGKIDRKKLPLPTATGDSRGCAAPRDPMELEMAQLWEQVLGVCPIGIHDNFFEVGGHSLKAVALMEAIRKRFDVTLPLTLLFQSPTIAALCHKLRDSGDFASRDVLVLLRQGDGSRSPLFLVHPQGGGVMSYLPLVRELDDAETIYGIQSVGYESDEEPLTTMEEMTERFLAEIKQVQPKGPYRLAGWSFGGIAAYALALRLEMQGERVEFLGLFDVMPFDPENAEANAAQQSEEAALIHQAAAFGMDPAQLKGLSVEAGLDLVLRRAHELNRLPEGTTPESMRKKMRIMMLNGIAGFSYVPQGRVRADLTLFRCSEEPKQLELAHPLVDPEKWLPYTEGSVNVIPVPGDHHSLFHPPHVSALAEAMKPLLRATERDKQEV